MDIKLIDCTLRDGGFLNNWEFCDKDILSIIKLLNNSGIEIIECGYLDSSAEKENNTTLFNSVEHFENLISKSEIANQITSKLYLMINYKSKPSLSQISPKNEKIKYLEGIRLAFDKNEFESIKEYAKALFDKGYKLSFQPMKTFVYSESELIDLINFANKLDIEIFYIVDSFGNITHTELNKIFNLVFKYLNPKIKIGFHPHNNIHLAFSNTIHFLDVSKNNNVVIDCSISGVGRGGGNLCSEMITYYLNLNHNKKYNILPILEALEHKELDKAMNVEFNSKKQFLYFISALKPCHPNYITFFIDKGLNIISINNFIDNIETDKCYFFDSDYAEYLYYELNNFI